MTPAIDLPNVDCTADSGDTAAISNTKKSGVYHLSKRQTRTRDTARYNELLNAEKCDETGELESQYKPRILIKLCQPKTKGRNEPVAASDADSTDIEFLPPLIEDSDSEGEEEEEEEGGGRGSVNDVISNEEIAASLPTKLASKRKRTQGTSKTHVTKKRRQLLAIMNF
ncbi:hypothetical protein BDQ17DRAFT_1335936 [Cyathus striatus]|nr:hypothetical protein BDQ17DRAFT_1335936 [Cyathus striatus]